MDPKGPKNMQKKPNVPRNDSEERVFNFDLEIMKKALGSGVVSFPPGLTGEERREWIRNRRKNSPPTS